MPVGSTLGCRDVGKAVVRAGKAMGKPRAVQAGVYPFCFGKVCFRGHVQKLEAWSEYSQTASDHFKFEHFLSSN